MAKEAFDKTSIFTNIKADFDAAKKSRHRVEQRIAEWKRIYDGKPYGNEVKHRSQFVVKDVQKHAKTSKPSLMEPFLGSDTLIKVKNTNTGNASSASFHQHILNYQWTTQFDNLSFLDTLSDVLQKEGTCFIRVGWDLEERKKVKILKGMNRQQLLAASYSGNLTDITQQKDGTYSAKLTLSKIIKNQPTAKVCKNESIYTDPTAESDADWKFIIHEYEMSTSDILKQPNMYPEFHKIKAPEDEGKDSWIDTYLGSERYSNTRDLGSDDTFKFAGKASKKITLLEYWGEGDINNDGINEQIVCVWIKGTDKILRLEENPYPFQKIPFVAAPFDREPFALWGNSMADSMADNQKVRTAMMRGFIDNMSLSNNGQKFYQKGALDYGNLKKLVSGYRFIEVNDINMFKDGSFNEFPQSAYNMYQMLEEDNESLSGVTKNMNGLDSATVGRTASGVNNVMSAAQRRSMLTVRNISNMLRKMFRMWAEMNEEFLDDGTIFDINGEYLQVSREQLKGKHDFSIQIGMDAQNQSKMQQINMLLQQAQSLEGSIPPMVVRSLVAEFFDAMGKNTMAEQIRTMPEPEPDPMQIEFQELEMREKEVAILEKEASAKLKLAQAEKALKEARENAEEMDEQYNDLKHQQELRHNDEKHMQGMEIKSREASQKSAINALMAKQKMSALAAQ